METLSTGGCGSGATRRILTGTAPGADVNIGTFTFTGFFDP